MKRARVPPADVSQFFDREAQVDRGLDGSDEDEENELGKRSLAYHILSIR